MVSGAGAAASGGSSDPSPAEAGQSSTAPDSGGVGRGDRTTDHQLAAYRDAVVPTWRRALPVGALAAVAFIAALLVRKCLLPLDSGDRDEPVYRFQALLLRDGHFSLPASQEMFYRPWLSGLHNQRLVLPFTAPWPAVLAASGALFGTTVVALGAVAAAATVGCYLFTHELLGERRTALMATALVSLSPFMLALSGTYLNYVLALAIELFAAWTLLRGMRADGRATPLLVASGALWAAAFWCRPLDAILVGLPFAALLLLRGAKGSALASRIGRLGVGAVPVLAAVMLGNRKATGSALTLPVSAQSNGAARPGWGMRGLFEGELTVDYTLGKAFRSLGTNLWALPTWLLGAHLAVVLAVYGGWRLWRRDRAVTLLLVGFVVVCPIGYLGWFASALTTAGAFTGIGPHYYLPSVVPLAVLAAVGAGDLWDRRTALRPVLRPVFASVALAVLLAATVVAVVPKWRVRLRESRYDQRFQRTVERGLQQRGERPALVVLPPTTGTDGVMRVHSSLANRPDLSGPVVYALDRGAGLFDLLQRQRGRVPFRLTTELQPGAELSMPDAVMQPIDIVRGAAVEVRTRLTNTSLNPVVVATVEQGGRVRSVLLDERSGFGRTYEVTWRVTPDGMVEAEVGGRARLIRLRLDSEGEVSFGVASGADRSLLDDPDPSRAVKRLTYRSTPATRSIQASTATADDFRFGGSAGAWLPIDVNNVVEAVVSAR